MSVEIPAEARPLQRRNAWRVFLAAAAAAALIAFSAWGAHHWALSRGVEALRIEGKHRLEMVSKLLDADLARYGYLPSLLEMTPGIFDLLDRPDDPARRARVNRYLQGINAAAGADMLFVLDRHGTALAASDADRPHTTVGSNYAFRPYVREAMASGKGRFYGVGITTGKPGYYLSYALERHGERRGVVAVKASIDEVESAWRRLPGAVLAVDQRGVVILSTRDDWKFRPLAVLPEAVRLAVATERPYGDAAQTPIDWQVREELGTDVAQVAADGEPFLVNWRTLARTPWRVAVLSEMAPVRAAARNAALLAGMAAAVVCLSTVVFWQRRRAERLRLAGQSALQAAYANLETMVAERTAQLRSAQNDLVHSGKMAVLGRMSAGMVHELNQPLGALRTLSDNASVLLDQGRVAEVRSNLDRIVRLVDRLGKLTRQLKAFAHKAEVQRVPVDIRRAVLGVQMLVSAQLREQGVELEVDVMPPDLAALAEETRLEQVLTNLVGNAIDAMVGARRRRLRIHAEREGERCLVSVADTGPGIRADVLPRLFEPFVTTKPVGAGLGLGLMISARIVEEFGGRLRAENLPQGGARFSFDLPCAEADTFSANKS